MAREFLEYLESPVLGTIIDTNHIVHAGTDTVQDISKGFFFVKSGYDDNDLGQGLPIPFGSKIKKPVPLPA